MARDWGNKKTRIKDTSLSEVHLYMGGQQGIVVSRAYVKGQMRRQEGMVSLPKDVAYELMRGCLEGLLNRILIFRDGRRIYEIGLEYDQARDKFKKKRQLFGEYGLNTDEQGDRYTRITGEELD
ncbi:MAG: hypothetical protein Q8N88_04020 [Nanoarchaeota archaeon]|nr:hypothetical protein [Nanoarchaeota archaeon]